MALQELRTFTEEYEGTLLRKVGWFQKVADLVEELNRENEHIEIYMASFSLDHSVFYVQ